MEYLYQLYQIVYIGSIRREGQAPNTMDNAIAQ